MNEKFSDIIDIPAIQKLMRSSFAICCIPVILIDANKRVIITADGMDVFNPIHCRTQEAKLLFHERETFIHDHLCSFGDQAKSIYTEHHCKNGLIDIAVPIVIQDRHLASIFLGPFFYESPHRDDLIRKESLFGSMFKNVPILSRQRVKNILDYYTAFVDLLTKMGVQSLKESKAQDDLCKNQILLLSVLNHIDNAILALDKDLRVIYFNENYLRLYPFNRDFMVTRPTIQELIKKACKEGLYPPDQESELIARRLQHLEFASPTYLIETPRLDGVVVEGFVAKLPEWGYLQTFRDITSRKKAEKELRISEERLRTLIDVVPSMIFAKNSEGRFLAANKTMADSLGMPVNELVGKLHADVHPLPDEVAMMLEQDQHVLKTKRETHTIQESYFDIYGIKRWLQLTKVSCSDNIFGEPAVVGSAIDITKLIQTEDLLIKSLKETEETKNKIESILKSVCDGLIFSDTAGRVVLMSSSAEGVLGKQSHEISFKPIESLIEDKSFLEKFGAICSGEKNEFLINMDLRSYPGGEVRNYECHSSMVRGSDGNRLGILTLLRDVSRERELDRIKSEFIATAAHELRTPLTVVMGFSEILLKNKDIKEGQRTEYLSIIHKKSEVLGKIIDDLLDLARVDSGKVINLKKDWADIRSIISRCVTDYQRAFPDHHFEAILNGKLDRIFVDDRKLFQVMENLLGNAVKFSPIGSQILVTSEVFEGFVRVSVSDEGCGMTADQVEKVFDKFYRGDSSNTAKEGLGLGMAIVKGIIEAHCGKIWVESELGKGTKVIFTLPQRESH